MRNFLGCSQQNPSKWLSGNHNSGFRNMKEKLHLPFGDYPLSILFTDKIGKKRIPFSTDEETFLFPSKISWMENVEQRFTVNVLHGRALQQGLQYVTFPLRKSITLFFSSFWI